jgi:Molybdopterin-binding domain of aldehyde dehydrogenase
MYRADERIRVISRRELIRAGAASGIALTLTRLAAAEEPAFAAHETMPGLQGWNPAATGAGRIDGVAKVTGAKLYASDFRAADMPGWPSETSHALLLRAADATHVYAGLDLSRLSGALNPAIVTADDLARIGTRVPEFYAGDLFCPVGRTPLYLGQPIALLIFQDFDAFDQGRLALRDQAFAKFGKETGPVEMPSYGAFRFTRLGGPTPEAADIYSPVKNGWVSPGKFQHMGQNTEAPIWGRLPIPTGASYAEAADIGAKIRAELASDDPALLVLERQFDTQSVDPMFLEPESGLAWYDSSGKTLALVVGVQSPYEAAESVAFLVGEADAKFRPARIDMNFAYCGGGFGGRDHTPFPLYLALAAMVFPDRPVRLANNRFDQFQSGIKRHAFNIRTRIGVDRATGKIVGFAGDHALDGRRSRQFFPQRGDRRRDGRAGRLLCPESRRHDVCIPFARCDRGVDARVRNPANHDRARGDGRRNLYGAAARSDRVPPAKRAPGWLENNDRQSLHCFHPNAGDPRQARAASDLARSRPGEGACAVRSPRRHGRRLRCQGLRHGSGLLARVRPNQCGWEDHDPL